MIPILVWLGVIGLVIIVMIVARGADAALWRWFDDHNEFRKEDIVAVTIFWPIFGVLFGLYYIGKYLIFRPLDGLGRMLKARKERLKK